MRILRKKKINNDNLKSQLMELKSNHIKKLVCIIPPTREKMYVCSGYKLEIEINFSKHDFMKVNSSGLHLGAYQRNSYNRNYIEENIKILLFFVDEMREISNKNLSDTVYYVSNYPYKEVIKRHKGGNK